MERNNSEKNEDKSSQAIYNYPSLEELELQILKLSPCSISDLLRDRNMEVKSGHIEVMANRIKILESNGKVKVRRLNKVWIIYPSAYEEWKKKEIQKRLVALGLDMKKEVIGWMEKK